MLTEVVTRNVMRSVTVASLLTVWGAANEHTSDGIFRNADLNDIDDMVGIPGFGEAMQSVGWAKYDKENECVILPNFNEYNTCGRDRAAEKNAERQRRYREKKKADSNDDSNVTNDVTNNGREEKRREEKNNNPSVVSPGKKFTPPTVEEVTEYCKERNSIVDPQKFCDFYTAKGWMVGKNRMKDWKACVRTWETNRDGQSTPPAGPSGLSSRRLN